MHSCKKTTATDGCSKCTIVGKTNDPLKYSTAGIYTIHWSYADHSGKTITQNQTMIVRDNATPVACVPPIGSTYLVALVPGGHAVRCL